MINNGKISVAKLKALLQEFSDDTKYSIAYSTIYGFYLYDKDGKSVGYISDDGVHFWEEEI